MTAPINKSLSGLEITLSTLSFGMEEVGATWRWETKGNFATTDHGDSKQFIVALSSFN